MNGILCIDKPAGFTSFDVVAKLRGMAKTRKIGHGGTLDPMATGVLPLFLGIATKACDLLPNQDKGYIATFRLGTVTDTLDITGTVLETRPVTAGAGQVWRTALKFVGKSSQLPPMYSAVQVNGVRLYDLARKGVQVERSPREIEIHGIELLRADEEQAEYTVQVHCSKGVYVRSLCHDIGQRLGCGAVLTALRRTLACGYGLEDCITLEQAQQLTDAGTLSGRLLPVESAFRELPRLELSEKHAHLLQNGVRMDMCALDGPAVGEGALLAAFGPGGRFLGLAYPDRGQLRVKKLFVREAVS